MKTLVLPSGKTLVYEAVGTTCTESELTISFKSNNTPNEIQSILKDTKDLQSIIKDVDVTKIDYSVPVMVTQDLKSGIYTIALNEDNLSNQIETLRAEKEALSSTLDELIEVVIPDLLESINTEV